MTPDLSTAPTSVPATLQVAACTGDGGVRMEERPCPAPQPGELLLRMRCAGLCGTDLFKLVHRTAAAGTVLGHEIVGDVVEAGAGVADFQRGDRVVVPHHVACGVCALCRRGNETLCDTFRENLLDPGGFVSYVLVKVRAVREAARRLPESLPDAEAVFMEPAACVLRGVQRANLAPAAAVVAPCVVVIGGGSMGLLHLLVLRAVRPDIGVIVCDPLQERRELAMELGACRSVAPGDELASVVNELSRGLGADATFDTVGGNEVLNGAFEVLREGGTAVLFAHAGDGERGSFPLNPFFKSERRIVSTYSAGLAEQKEIFGLLVTGRLRPSPLVTHRLPLEKLGEAIDLATQREALKVLLEGPAHDRGGTSPPA